MSTRQKEGINIKQLIKILILALIIAVLFHYYPENVERGVIISRDYGLKMISILPAVLILMGLVDVWVPEKLIKKYLGQNTGFKGIITAIILGTLPTGPMYVAFPIASELLRKKAGLKNVIIFLGVWASLKIPQIGVEIQFLGLKFTTLRFALTLLSVISIGIIIELMCKKRCKYVQFEESQ